MLPEHVWSTNLVVQELHSSKNLNFGEERWWELKFPGVVEGTNSDSHVAKKKKKKKQKFGSTMKVSNVL